jgi:hypothetical protein
MVHLQGDLWAKELTLQPGKYEYRFIVDDVWTTDPKNAESTANPFGETNSILRVNTPENKIAGGAAARPELHQKPLLDRPAASSVRLGAI